MKKNTNSNGFTLIEIMIVIIIIGIMSTLVVISVSNVTYRKFITETNKFAQLLQILGDEAIYTDSTIKCELNDHNFIDCAKYRDGEWTDIDLDKSIDIHMQKDFKINQILARNTIDNKNVALYFYSHGDNDIYHIKVSEVEYSAWIDSDLEGNFSVSN